MTTAPEPSRASGHPTAAILAPIAADARGLATVVSRSKTGKYSIDSVVGIVKPLRSTSPRVELELSPFRSPRSGCALHPSGALRRYGRAHRTPSNLRPSRTDLG